jgi:hypothetical protein
MPSCKLTPDPGGVYDFWADAREVVTIVAAPAGRVSFLAAAYGGSQLSLSDPGRITFTIAPGLNTLDIVCFFSDPASGEQAALHEDCDRNTQLRTIDPSAPAISLTIYGLFGAGFVSPGPHGPGGGEPDDEGFSAASTHGPGEGAP